MTDVKSKLIEEINKIEDESILHQLTELVVGSDKELIAEFNPDQIEKINESQDQIINNESYTHEEVMKMMRSDD